MSISVIVPSYNCGRFVGEALDSILGQTRTPDQIILVDDGSTDDTEAVVRSYTDPRIEYVKKSNGGISSARNAGLNAARGEFVTFLDADDRWRPTFVERMLDLLKADPSAVCAFSNFVRFQHETRELQGDQFRLYPDSLRVPFGRIPHDLAFSTFVACQEIPAYTQVMMFRREMIAPLRFDQTLVLGEDSNFALRTYMHGSVVFTDEVLAEVRRHGTNTTRNYREMVIHTLNGLRALAPYVTRKADLVPYRDRLVKAYVSASIYQVSIGRLRAGLRYYWDGLRVPGSQMRKIKGFVRMAMALPGGLLA